MTTRPDIIVICTDQQRYDSLGCTGNPGAVTPHLDALAAESCLCRRFFTANAVCMPSRASLLSGLYPSSHGVWTNGVPLPRRGYVPESDPSGGGLPPGASPVSQVDTLADHLARCGYRTASIGKLHLTPTAAPASLGFEECRQRWDAHDLDDWQGPYFGFEHVELSIGHGVKVTGHYGRWLEQRFPAVAAAVEEWRGVSAIPGLQLFDSPVPVEAHHSTWCGERAAAYLAEADAEQPCFLWLGLPDPHHPFAPPRELLDGFRARPVQEPLAPGSDHAKPAAWQQFLRPGSGWSCPPEAVPLIRRATDAMLHLIDRAVGQVVAAQQARGRWNDTLLVFTSDHGDFLGDFGLVFKTSTAAAALHHVPLILRLPGTGLPALLDTPLSAVDLVPTLVAAAGGTVPGELPGEDIRAVAAQGRRRQVRAEDYPNGAPGERNLTVYDQHHRYTWYPATGERELYDHDEDPGERRNLAADPRQRATIERLHADLQQQFLADHHPNQGRVAIW